MNLVDLTVEIDQCNCFAVRKAARRVSRFYEDLLQPAGLRITQFLILAVLAKVPGGSVNELAERLELERTAMGKTLGPLERDGLIRIEPSPIDGRSRTVTLTSKGHRVFRHALPLWSQAQHQLAELNGTQWINALRSRLSEIKVDKANIRSADKEKRAQKAGAINSQRRGLCGKD
jgi:DNA-binding MarR family transcriptional regulator